MTFTLISLPPCRSLRQRPQKTVYIMFNENAKNAKIAYFKANN